MMVVCLFAVVAVGAVRLGSQPAARLVDSGPGAGCPPVQVRHPAPVAMAVLGAGVVFGVHVLGLAISALGVWHATRRVRARRLALGRVAYELPAVVDLVAGALEGGLTPISAIGEIALRHRGCLARDLAAVEVLHRRGRPLDQALQALVDRRGEVMRSFADLLGAPDRHGAAVADGLRELAAELRADLRRDAEIAARRLPVRLLFPLISCVLPAFVALTVVPVVAEAVASFTR